MESFKNSQEFKQEQQLHAEGKAEFLERYPTLESTVDDYRNGLLTQQEVSLGYPEPSDLDRLVELANERNLADGEIEK